MDAERKNLQLSLKDTKATLELAQNALQQRLGKQARARAAKAAMSAWRNQVEEGKMQAWIVKFLGDHRALQVASLPRSSAFAPRCLGLTLCRSQTMKDAFGWWWAMVDEEKREERRGRTVTAPASAASAAVSDGAEEHSTRGGLCGEDGGRGRAEHGEKREKEEEERAGKEGLSVSSLAKSCGVTWD
eukprot:792176-Rhodomonas_salina.1